GIKAVKKSRATQVSLSGCAIGGRCERPRQSTLRELVHEFDRAGLERNACAEELLQAIGEFALILVDAKLRSEVVLYQSEAFVVRKPDQALVQFLAHVEAKPC